jgi:hypothetical protein
MCVLTNFFELVMLFDIANIYRFPFPVQEKAPVAYKAQRDFTNFSELFLLF